MREKSPSVPLIYPGNGSVFHASQIQVNGNTFIHKKITIYLQFIYNNIIPKKQLT